MSFWASVISWAAPIIAEGAGEMDSERAKDTRSGARDCALACMKCWARVCIVLDMCTVYFILNEYQIISKLQTCVERYYTFHKHACEYRSCLQDKIYYSARTN